MTLTTYLAEKTIGHQRFVVGSYVYVWYDENLPFYIGSGTGRRAWNEHLPYIESIRLASLDWKVLIYSHFHTKEAAHATERRLIASYLKRGLLLANTRLPASSGPFPPPAPCLPRNKHVSISQKS